MSKSSWTLLGCLLLALAGCGGRSSNTDSVRNLDEVGDAGGVASSEADSGAPESEPAPTMDGSEPPSMDAGAAEPTLPTPTPDPSPSVPVDAGSLPAPVVVPTTEPPVEPEMLPEPAMEPPVDIDDGECQGYHSPGATDC
jgi:hypothetical protein